ncbi:alkaline phosphatase [Roseococcus sp. SDR]|uniref:alkaline phosphatase n=1 Tax=Roseococcus sp. SDR TaxID=2835532 RepID=UPI001BCD8C01|nr:alkaline phosphatase [Roseococcus sp. SDR]MBS7790580.1 alkaline phosphatase [Roseococcus sp. SDR]MBV1845894.1 alkaline phosphatase [Roseococcus sp. SDR]
MNRRSLFASTAALALAAHGPAAAQGAPRPTNVIFFHPDGFGVAAWGAVRMVSVGPDGRTEWDRLPHSAVYLGHMKDGLTSTSHGGATTHAFGRRVQADSFGMDGDQPIRGLSGFEGSIAKEALARGKWVGLVQTGAAYEPGTAAFVASTPRRNNLAEITRLVVESGVQLHLAGGERWYLPRGMQGRFGEGAREDGLNLIELLRQRGYTIVFTKEELAAVPAGTEKLWGIFAHDHSFHDRNEETLARENLPHYVPSAPSIAEMSEAALRFLSRAPDGFFLVAEEEGTDNFGNVNNAAGAIEAGIRADAAIGVFRRFVAANPNTLMLTTCDSDAGGMQVIGPGRQQNVIREGANLPERDRNGAPLDGQRGTATTAWLSAPDRNGVRHPFAIAWSTLTDVSGAILVRAVGLNAERVSQAGTMDNVDVYRLMYRTLFGRDPG